MAGLYIHIPFCRQKCRYCDFYSIASDALAAPMLDSLGAELDARAGEFAGETISTVYFGGGTPTVYSPQELQGLIDRARRRYRMDALQEVTVEANPDDLTDEYLEALRDTEVNRLSIGVQSFVDSHLELFNRRHTGQQAVDAVLRAKKYGFENLTIDLIYGVPGMTEQQWESNLSRFIELDVPHLSAYHLGIEPRTVLGKWAEQGRITAVSEEVSQSHYDRLEQVASEAGYVHYEISNFARSGYEAVHNSNYWRGVPYLGIGPSAHSFLGDVRRWNTANNRNYIENAGTKNGFETEYLSPVDRLNEMLMTGLRTAVGVNLRQLSNTFGSDCVGALLENAQKHINRGLLTTDGQYLRIPTGCFLLSDSVISDLFLLESAF